MHIASMYSYSWPTSAALPPAAFRPLCLLVIPIATQIAYRIIRNRMYSHMNEASHFQKDSPKMEQRKFQHKLYMGAVFIQVLGFAFFARSNKFYWAPTAFSLSFFAWTDFTKRQEKIIGNVFESMDRKIPFSNS